jgi:hypothetical protein
MLEGGPNSIRVAGVEVELLALYETLVIANLPETTSDLIIAHTSPEKAAMSG